LVVFDGYDLIVYGTVQSSLISETGWGLTKATAGTIGSMAFLGMMIGAIFAGRMADSWGRRRTILGCAIVFSIFSSPASGSAVWCPRRTPSLPNWSPPNGGPPSPP
jgi:AAHS family benzoate transporter-like MFS transporter